MATRKRLLEEAAELYIQSPVRRYDDYGTPTWVEMSDSQAIVLTLQLPEFADLRDKYEMFIAQSVLSPGYGENGLWQYIDNLMTRADNALFNKTYPTMKAAEDVAYAEQIAYSAAATDLILKARNINSGNTTDIIEKTLAELRGDTSDYENKAFSNTIGYARKGQFGSFKITLSKAQNINAMANDLRAIADALEANAAPVIEVSITELLGQPTPPDHYGDGSTNAPCVQCGTIHDYNIDERYFCSEECKVTFFKPYQDGANALAAEKQAKEDAARQKRIKDTEEREARWAARNAEIAAEIAEQEAEEARIVQEAKDMELGRKMREERETREIDGEFSNDLSDDEPYILDQD